MDLRGARGSDQSVAGHRRVGDGEDLRRARGAGQREGISIAPHGYGRRGEGKCRRPQTAGGRQEGVVAIGQTRRACQRGETEQGSDGGIGGSTHGGEIQQIDAPQAITNFKGQQRHGRPTGGHEPTRAHLERADRIVDHLKIPCATRSAVQRQSRAAYAHRATRVTRARARPGGDGATRVGDDGRVAQVSRERERARVHRCRPRVSVRARQPDGATARLRQGQGA